MNKLLQWYRKLKKTTALRPVAQKAVDLGFPLKIDDVWLPCVYINGKRRKVHVGRPIDTYRTGDVFTLFKTSKNKRPYLRYKIIDYRHMPGSDWGCVTNKEYSVEFVGFASKKDKENEL